MAPFLFNSSSDHNVRPLHSAIFGDLHTYVPKGTQRLVLEEGSSRPKLCTFSAVPFRA